MFFRKKTTAEIGRELERKLLRDHGVPPDYHSLSVDDHEFDNYYLYQIMYSSMYNGKMLTKIYNVLYWVPILLASILFLLVYQSLNL